jgi:transposase InsO family protein
LQTDNGPEFANKIIQSWAKYQNIHLSRSATYQPTSNALIENFNNILRKIIREGFIRNNSLNWVDHLQTYINNRNNTKHSTTKYKPVDLWRTGRKAFNAEDENTPKEIKEVKERIEDKARKDMAKFKSEVYKV